MAYQSQLQLIHQLFQQFPTRKPHWTWEAIIHVHIPAHRAYAQNTPRFSGATNPDFYQYRAELMTWRNLCKSSLLPVCQKSILMNHRERAWRRRTSLPRDRTANASPTSHTLLPYYCHSSSSSSTTTTTSVSNTSSTRTHNPSTNATTVSPADRCSTSDYKPSTRKYSSSTNKPPSSHGYWVCPCCRCTWRGTSERSGRRRRRCRGPGSSWPGG
ncbi:hypothetical protein BGZ57DRAFT_880472 [Hyaloscypha finlandica]|nr:hypothetical protein BGZ57DRAFT_880472 [Hyaloscypha finlandica]